MLNIVLLLAFTLATPSASPSPAAEPFRLSVNGAGSQGTLPVLVGGLARHHHDGGGHDDAGRSLAEILMPASVNAAPDVINYFDPWRNPAPSAS